MALGNPPAGTARRSGLTSGPTRYSGPARDERGDDDGRRGGGQQRDASSWTTACSMYDTYHGALEVKVKNGLYETGILVSIAGVIAGMAGRPAAPGEAKYGHKDGISVYFDLPNAIVFRMQLAAFLRNDLNLVEVTRESERAGVPNKRLLLANGTAYYQEDHPDFELHGSAKAIAIEQDEGEKATAKEVVFMSRPALVQMGEPEEDGEPIYATVFPELEALLAVFSSYIDNCARVDYGAMQLSSPRGDDRRDAPQIAGAPKRIASAPPPAPATARGLAPSATRDAPPPRAAAHAPAQTTVAEKDIDAAIGGEDGEREF